MCNFRIFPKLLHFGKIPKKIGRNLANKPLSGPRRRAPRPERGAWRRLCTAWVHSRKPCKRRTANRNEQKFTEQKRTCAIWNDSVGLIQHFSSRWPCRPLFRKCNNTSEHEFRGTGRAPLSAEKRNIAAWNYECQRWERRFNIGIKDIIVLLSSNCFEKFWKLDFHFRLLLKLINSNWVKLDKLEKLRKI